MEQVTREGHNECIIVDTAQARLARMRRGVLTAARLLAESSTAGGRWVMVTQTYAPHAEWTALHQTQFVKRLRAWSNRRGFTARYVWVMELTKAGVPHYHTLVWVPKGHTLPKADKRGWWPHGMTRTEVARSAVGYLAKYSSKGSSGLYPKGARIHGSGGLGEQLPVLRWWMLPKYVRDAVDAADRMRRVCGGFLSRVTGEFIEGRYLYGGGGPGFVRLLRRA